MTNAYIDTVGVGDRTRLKLGSIIPLVPAAPAPAPPLSGLQQIFAETVD